MLGVKEISRVPPFFFFFKLGPDPTTFLKHNQVLVFLVGVILLKRMIILVVRERMSDFYQEVNQTGWLAGLMEADERIKRKKE